MTDAMNGRTVFNHEQQCIEIRFQFDPDTFTIEEVNQLQEKLWSRLLDDAVKILSAKTKV